MRWALLCLLVACWRDAAPPQHPSETSEDVPPEPQPVFHSRWAPPTPHDKRINAFEDLRGIADQFCACTGPTCTQQVMTELQQWSERMSADPDLREVHPTAEEEQLQTEIQKQLTDCVMRSMSPPNQPPPQPSPSSP